jgi:hypothetical protein
LVCGMLVRKISDMPQSQDAIKYPLIVTSVASNLKSPV